MSTPERTAAPKSDADVQREIARLTRRSFAVGGAAGLTGLGGLAWLMTRKDDDGAPWPLRRVLEFNESPSRAYFSRTRLAPTFPTDLAREPRPNGKYGLRNPLDEATWKFDVTSSAAGSPQLKLSLADVQALPRVEMVTELKCIEGWSEIVHWAGARLSDFASHYRLATRSGQPLDLDRRPEDVLSYVGLATPDGQYYVGLDMPSALHSQTLLAYELNGQPLTAMHGAPLRLVIPVKYGIKHLKRIGSLTFTDQRPPDYWAQQGYDWYSGH